MRREAYTKAYNNAPGTVATAAAATAGIAMTQSSQAQQRDVQRHRRPIIECDSPVYCDSQWLNNEPRNVALAS